MTRHRHRSQRREGVRLLLHGGRSDRAAAVHRPGRRLRPRVPGESAVEQGRRRRGARRGAHAEQRRSEGGGGHASSRPTSRPAISARWPATRRRSGSFFKLSTVAATGVNIVDVNASATLPTTFMKLAHRNEVWSPRAAKRRGAWSTCRWSSTSRAPSARSGPRCATRRAPSSTASTRRPIACRSSRSATAPRSSTRCRPAAASTRTR